MKKEEPIRKVGKKIRKGDRVIVTAGNYKGQIGTVLSCAAEKAVVQGVNVRTRHMKGRGQQPGQRITLEKPIHISNISLCSSEDKPVKLKVRFDDNGERQFVYKRDGTEVLHRVIKKPAQ